ncbi:MAG: bifunctional phosphoribosyl-AMP cyclohydrolase/phosphoribosyl-ATP diphosphatase HisIE [Deinococcota bacterium]
MNVADIHATSEPLTLDDINFDNRGLVPVITQDRYSGEVLMLAYANREAVEQTLQTGEAHYYSRSRQSLWHKGATSGHIQKVNEVRIDCDEDTLLYRVDQTGAACHTGEYSCFFRNLDGAQAPAIGEMLMLLERTVEQRIRDLPEGSYVSKLHTRGVGYISQKVVEEAGESIVAALEDKPDELTSEVADLLFHLTVLIQEKDLNLQDVASELARRHQK